VSGSAVPQLKEGQYEALRKKPLREMSTEEHAQMRPFNGCQRKRVIRSNLDGSVVTGNCGATRWQECTYCAGLYAGDVRHLMHKGASAEDRQFDNDVVFLTLTAPSFGPVHTAPAFSFEDEVFKRGQEKRKRCMCGAFHKPEEGMQGVPLNAARNKDEEQVRFNANVSGILEAFLKSLNKKLKRLGLVGTLPYVRVLELQARLVLHVHAVLLVPHWLIVAMGGENAFREVVEKTAAAVTYQPKNGGKPIEWGDQTKTVIHPALDRGASVEEEIQWLERRSAMLKYLAKYASKGLGVNPAELSDKQKSHLRRLVSVARGMVRAEKEEALAKIDPADPDLVLKQARVHKKFFRIAESGGCRARVFSKNRAWTEETLQDRREDRSIHRSAESEEVVEQKTEHVAPKETEVVPPGWLLIRETGELIPKWVNVACVKLPTVADIQDFGSYTPEKLQRIFRPAPPRPLTWREKLRTTSPDNDPPTKRGPEPRKSGRRQQGIRSKVST
jgi:hypothetical protein